MDDRETTTIVAKKVGLLEIAAENDEQGRNCGDKIKWTLETRDGRIVAVVEPA